MTTKSLTKDTLVGEGWDLIDDSYFNVFLHPAFLRITVKVSKHMMLVHCGECGSVVATETCEKRVIKFLMKFIDLHELMHLDVGDFFNCAPGEPGTP